MAKTDGQSGSGAGGSSSTRSGASSGTSTGGAAGAGIGALLLLLAVGGLRYYSIWGVADLGGACSTRLGCKSQLCAAHERRGGALVPAAGYCTAGCRGDAECTAGAGEGRGPRLRCEPTGPELRKDIPGIGIPDHLCVRGAP